MPSRRYHDGATTMKRPRHDIGGNGHPRCCQSPLPSPSFRPARRRRATPKMTSALLLPSSSCVALALTTLLLASTVVGMATAATAAAAATDDAPHQRDYLNEDSVVLILGAAGFIGSELAMALHRTYSPRKLLCVDSMASGLGPGGSAVSATGNMQTENDWKDGMAAKNKNSLKARTEEELALFEFKRQRAFHVLQTVGDRVHFYRSDFRPTIPEYFDTGEVPLLDTIFQSHPDITHVVHLADPYHSAMFDKDENGIGLTQAVPRTKDSTKSGMMEAIMEQLLKVKRERGATAVPHLVYASSFEVYNHAYPYDKEEDNPNPPPFREDRNITVPSTLRGTSKVIDEILATTYNNFHGLYSVGMRFFPVYGPWGLPGSPLFEMAERAVSDPTAPILIEGRRRGSAVGNEKDDGGSSSALPMRSGGQQLPDDVRDYVYIDDAVDAIMTAMQYRPASKSTGDGIGAAPNLMINVGSGIGSTLRDVASIMEEHFARSSEGARSAIKSDENANTRAKIDPSVSIASTDRAEILLGFTTSVSLEEGIANLLAWHFDRAFPYGGKPPTPGSAKAAGGAEAPGNEKEDKAKAKDANSNKSLTGGHTIADHGIEACSPFDRECLHGAPVFPCASECSHESQCIKSYFDDATHISRSITAGCDAVLYTVHLGDDIENIPSAHTAVSTDSVSYFDDNGKRCNVAFVSEGSKLVRRLKKEKGLAQFMSVSEEFLRRINDGDGRGAANVLITHGFWTLIPVATPPRPSSQAASWESSDSYDDWDLLRLVPKISPGLFFSGQTKHAIYANPDITFANIHNILREAKMQPYKEGMRGATAAVVGDGHAEAERRRARGDKAKFVDEGAPNSSRARSGALQLRAYNMIRVGLQGEMLGGGDIPIAESSWIVHTLGVEDARLFRCDVLGEIIQWEVGSDERSLEFIMGLHDLWSRVIVSWGGVDPWWKRKGSDEVSVVPMTVSTAAAPETPVEKVQENRRRLTDLSRGGDGIGSRRRLDERSGESDKSASADGLWMGVLSSTEIHYFVRILASSAVGAVHVDEYTS